MADLAAWPRRWPAAAPAIMTHDGFTDRNLHLDLHFAAPGSSVVD